MMLSSLIVACLLLPVSQSSSQETPLQRGERMLQEGELDAALIEFRKAAAIPALAGQGAAGAARVCARMDRADDAFGWLGRAVANGWGERDQLATDEDFALLADDERYADVLPPLLMGAAAFAGKVRVLHEWQGESAGDQYGWVARPMGDLDGDGVIDFASTAPTWRGARGMVHVISSRSGEQLFRYNGTQPGLQMGNSVAGRADVNADGTPDVLIGGPGSGKQPGQVVVLSGKDGSTLHELTRGVAGDGFGMKLSGIEDLDGDGHAEIVVGAASDGPGLVLVYSGKSGELLYEIPGEVAGDGFGTSLDGTHDGAHRLLIVGAPKAGQRRVGRAYVYECDDAGAELRFVIDTDKTGANLGQYFVTWLGDLNGDGVPDAYASDWSNGCKGPGTGRVFVHCGDTGERILTLSGHVRGEGFGTTAAVCGDANGDGAADMIIGAWQHSGVSRSAGACYLHSGKDGSLLATWKATQGGDTLGFDAVGLGDVDGDGAHDFLLTSAWSTLEHGRQGRVFLVAGPHFD
ncbi:MAG: hypothetical protein ACI8QC_002936, partial [Planctomycetota bacterium]